MSLINRVEEAALNLKTQYQATRLWNWIDSQSSPEILWGAMMAGAGWAFRDGSDANSICFVYDRNSTSNVTRPMGGVS